jgi:hypothetical protein
LPRKGGIGDKILRLNNTVQREKPKEKFFSGRLWYADQNGKDLNRGNLPFVVGSEYLWFTKNLIIPYNWIIEVKPVGPGFLIIWKNELNEDVNVGVYCVRSFLGYNLKKRDEILQAIEKAKQYALSMGGISYTENIKMNGCNKCGSKDARFFEFVFVASYFFTYQIRTESFYLCDKHAKEFFKQIFRRNLLFSFLGILGIIGRGNRENSKMMLEKGVINNGEYKRFKAYTFLPLLFFLCIIFLIIFTAS